MTFRGWLVFLNKPIPPNVHGHFELFFAVGEKITLVERLVAQASWLAIVPPTFQVLFRLALPRIAQLQAKGLRH